MKPDIWMPMYWADFLADTMHLNRAEIGSYVLMIGAYWRRGGPLPDDNEQLRQICRCDSQEWARCKGTMATFFSVAGGVWSHKRIDAEIAEAIKNKEAQYNRTKAATEARRNVTTNVTDNVTTNVTFTPSPSPSPSPKEERAPSPFAGRPNWTEFWAYCQQIGLGAEWFARDKFLAAESDNWRGKDNWTAYAQRCRKWWEDDGRPMKPKGKAGNVAPSNGPSLAEVSVYAKDKFQDTRVAGLAADFYRHWSRKEWKRNGKTIEWQEALTLQLKHWLAERQAA